MKRPALLLFVLAGYLLVLPFAGRAQEPDPIYARDHTEVYKAAGVKEVWMEMEQFYKGQVSLMRHLEQRLTLDPQGRLIRKETAAGPHLAYRLDNTYDEKGNLTGTTFYSRADRPASTIPQPNAKVTWKPEERTRYPKTGKEKAIAESWNPETKKWELTSKVFGHVKNDTSYTETLKPGSESKEISRIYQLGSDRTITRQDYLTYSIKGLREPKYYYHKIVEGRLMETGSVDFEAETMLHFQKHPESQLRLFGSKHSAHQLFDEIARRYPGTLEPTTTYTYNAQGQLIEKTQYETRIIYVRDAEGRVVTQSEIFSDKSGRIITYSYNPKGLLEKENRVYLSGIPEASRFYSYTYY